MRAAKDAIGINRDQYYVECGKLQNGKQPRFYLGRTNEISADAARIRRSRVREFWNKFQQPNRLNGYPVVDGPTLPYWSDEALDIAKQIAKGATRVPYGQPGTTPMLLVTLANLNAHYEGIVTFVSQDDAATASIKELGDQHRSLATAARMATPTNTSIISDDTETLHKWLDLFANHNCRTLTEADDDGKQISTEWGAVVVKTIELIRRAIPDMPLDRFGYAEIESAVLYFAGRPANLKNGKPVSTRYAKHCIKLIKRFVKWLPKHTTWRKPHEWEDAFSHQPKVSRIEKMNKPIGIVKSYTTDQLVTIYRYATSYERCLFLIALNCGFGAAEISQLRRQELALNPEGVSYIKRVRTKNAAGVYGEHLLWPETVQALQWAMAKAEQHVGDLTPQARVILRDSGKPLVTSTPSGRSNKAANAWVRLTKRIKDDENPDFPALSFNKLRKTAGNLIKRFSDGETVAVFHQRSSAVASDDEAEFYTDRLYDRVFKAQHEVHELLAPMFEAVPEPFPRQHQRTAVGLRTIDRIKELWAAGEPAAAIIAKTKASRATVYRYRPETSPAETDAPLSSTTTTP